MTSSKIIDQAHAWLDTRFKHQGRIKKNDQDKGGCDCLGLIMGVGGKTKSGELLQDFDQINYPKLLTSNLLLDQLDLLLERVEFKDIEPGNIILIRINNWPQHLAIIIEVTPHITIIHSYIQARSVVKQYLPEEWKRNIVAIYRA